MHVLLSVLHMYLDLSGVQALGGHSRCVVGDHITIRLSPLHVWAQYMYTLGLH